MVSRSVLVLHCKPADAFILLSNLDLLTEKLQGDSEQRRESAGIAGVLTLFEQDCNLGNVLCADVGYFQKKKKALYL